MGNLNRIVFSVALLCFLGFLSTIGAAAQQTPNSAADALVDTAITLYEAGKYDEALVNANKAAALNQNYARPHVMAGMIYMAQMKMKSASEAFARAIQLDPKRKELYVLKASADFEREAVDEALAACRKALEIDPNYAEAYAMLGRTLGGNEKRRAEAIAAYETAIKINPLVAAYEPLGELFIEAKDEKKAEEVFRKGIAADPTHMNSRFELGRMLVKQGRLAEARELWNGRTSDEDSTMPTFIQLLTRAENLKQATEALAKNPNDPDALIDMGIAVMDGDHWVIDGRQERALVYFKKALALKPNYAKAQYNIVKALIQYADTFERNNKKVTQELAKLRQLDPALGKEMEEYRKNYESGIIGGAPIKLDQ